MTFRGFSAKSPLEVERLSTLNTCALYRLARYEDSCSEPFIVKAIQKF